MEFILGGNYWASNAGTEMWREFDSAAVESDFQILTQHGVKVIRASDPSRPIVSGMHGLEADTHSSWVIRDQAMFTDFLTTHPYAYWCEGTTAVGIGKNVIGIHLAGYQEVIAAAFQGACHGLEKLPGAVFQTSSVTAGTGMWRNITEATAAGKPLMGCGWLVAVISIIFPGWMLSVSESVAQEISFPYCELPEGRNA